MTIPLVPFEGASLSLGDRLRVSAEGRGRIMMERIDRDADARSQARGLDVA